MRMPIFPLLALALAACASAPVTYRVEPLFADALFPPPAQPIRRDEVFALSGPMRDYLAQQIADQVRRKGPRVGLMEVLSEELRIDYDATMTRNAAQAFETRSGNCLSLAILTAALAKQLDIPVTFQSVYGYDTWSRSRGIAFRSGHVNLVLASRGSIHWLKGEPNRPLTVDFLPPNQATRLSARPISEETVVAMYMNNRAAEILAEGGVERAYWWAREAIKTDPSFLGSYNTLGVIYRRHGNLPQAERTLNQVLEHEPGNTEALSNLAVVMTALGRVAEAAGLKQRLAEIVANPPFQFFDQGMAALARGDNGAAVRWFNKELARMPYDEQLHFVMAIARLRQGEVRQARRHLTLAAEYSRTPDQREIYAAKLDHLRARNIN